MTAQHRAPPLIDWILNFLDQKKAEDVVCLEAPEGRFVTHMIIASGQSQRQVSSMAQGLYDELKVQGRHGVVIDGLLQADWVIVDAGSVMIHLFRPQVRAYYRLEELWDKSISTFEPTT